jgi:predicted secreted protein
MAVHDGSDIWVQIAGTLVNGLTEKNFDSETDEIDVTTQDSGESSEYIAGLSRHNITFGGKDDEAHTRGFDELWAAKEAKASVTFALGRGIKTAGGRLLTGSAIITKLSLTGNMNSEVTWSCTIRPTGTVALATSTTTVA